MITGDEFDAIAVHQCTGLPAVSLPLGASALPPEVYVTPVCVCVHVVVVCVCRVCKIGFVMPSVSLQIQTPQAVFPQYKY